MASSAYPYSHLARMRGRRIPNPRQIYSNQDMLLRKRQETHSRTEPETQNHDNGRHNAVDAEQLEGNFNGRSFSNSIHFQDSRLQHQRHNHTATHTQTLFEHSHNTSISGNHRDGVTELISQPLNGQQPTNIGNIAHILSASNHSRDSESQSSSAQSVIQQSDQRPRMRMSLYLPDNSDSDQMQDTSSEATESGSSRTTEEESNPASAQQPMFNQPSHQDQASNFGPFGNEIYSLNRRMFPYREVPQQSLAREQSDADSNNQEQASSRAGASFTNPQSFNPRDDNAPFQQSFYPDHPQANQRLNNQPLPYFNNQPNGHFFQNRQPLPQSYYGGHGSHSNYGPIRQPHFNYLGQNGYQPYMNNQQLLANGQGLNPFTPHDDRSAISANHDTTATFQSRDDVIADEDPSVSPDKSPSEAIASQYDAHTEQQTNIQRSPLHLSNEGRGQSNSGANEQSDALSGLPRMNGASDNDRASQYSYFPNHARQQYSARTPHIAHDGNYLSNDQSALFNGAIPEQPSYLGNDAISRNQQHGPSPGLSYLGNHHQPSNRRLFLRPLAGGRDDSFHSPRNAPIIVNSAQHYEGMGAPTNHLGAVVGAGDLTSHGQVVRNGDGAATGGKHLFAFKIFKENR